jgi:hypothetical protein
MARKLSGGAALHTDASGNNKESLVVGLSEYRIENPSPPRTGLTQTISNQRSQWHWTTKAAGLILLFSETVHTLTQPLCKLSRKGRLKFSSSRGIARAGNKSDLLLDK